MYTYTLSSLEPPTHPITLLQVITEYLAEFPGVCNNFRLAIYFTHGSVYLSKLLSQFVPPSPSLAVSTSLLSMSVSLFLPCKQVRQYHFSRFHIYALIDNICFSFSTSFCMTESRFVHISTNDPVLFLLMTNIPLYMLTHITRDACWCFQEQFNRPNWKSNSSLPDLSLLQLQWAAPLLHWLQLLRAVHSFMAMSKDSQAKRDYCF